MKRNDVCLENRALATAAINAFHSWRRALAAAGLASEENLAAGCKRWDKQRIIEEALKTRQQDGKKVTYSLFITFLCFVNDGSRITTVTSRFGVAFGRSKRKQRFTELLGRLRSDPEDNAFKTESAATLCPAVSSRVAFTVCVSAITGGDLPAIPCDSRIAPLRAWGPGCKKEVNVRHTNAFGILSL